MTQTDVILLGNEGQPTRFYGSVAQRLLQMGFNCNSLRQNDVLRKEEWQVFDDRLVEIARQRLNLVGDLMDRGLTFPLSNAMGTTVLQWEDVSDMDPAEISMDGISRTRDDRVLFGLNNIPIFITHKDFSINLRSLEASRTLGQPLDTTQLEVATRKVSESLETTLLNGAGINVAGNTAPGYTTFPERNTFELAASWLTATGEQMLGDVLGMITVAHADNMFGPYMLYVPTDYWVQLQDDFKANSDRSIIERLKAVGTIDDIKVADFLASDNVLLVQMTRDVIDEVDGQQPTMVQWEEQGGFKVNFKVLAIMVPRIKADQEGRCGIVHGSTASGGG